MVYRVNLTRASAEYGVQIPDVKNMASLIGHVHPQAELASGLLLALEPKLLAEN